jgi:DNA helicase-2/ATP-dependent DNA helicase PcrA
MDQAGLKIEPEVVAVLDYIAAGKSFLLSGGAGSGKTYSLVQVIGGVLRADQSAPVACITYTNSAVREIQSRIDSDRLFVSTIHDFLWGVIGSFQSGLKSVLLDCLSADIIKISPDKLEIIPAMFDGKNIQYKEYKRIIDGIVSHDEVIVLARAMFQRYPKLRDIVRDRFPYILVDEYQDTAPEVIDILLGILPQSSRKGIVGFFGDAMQSIYSDSGGDILSQVELGNISEVKKEQNRRNPRLVFELANRLRYDGIVQRASEDATAPNMWEGKVKDGTVRFYYTTGDNEDLGAVRRHLGWDFSDVAETKELNLTHNLIAPQAGFGDLMAIYDKDGILDFRDRIVDHIKKYDDLSKFTGLTFEAAIASLQKGKTGAALKAVSPTPAMRDFITMHPHLLADANGRDFEGFRQMYVNKDLLIGEKKHSDQEVARKGASRCEFIEHVFHIHEVAHLYETGRYNEFLRKTEFKLSRASDKSILRGYIEEIYSMSNRPVIEIIELADRRGLCRIDDSLLDFKNRKPYLYERVKSVPYRSFMSLYDYLEGRTGYSTQHKIKGLEFEKVLVVLDSGGWNKYNFAYLFEGQGTESVLNRTKKLFYVCCTRAKDTLAVYYHQPSEKALAQAREWFGSDNCVSL